MQITKHKISKLKIKPEYLELIPRLSDTDKRRLVDSIKKDGMMIPITVNSQGIILDGHTRYEICKEFGIKIKFAVKEFENEDDEMRFVVMTNVARRQLTKFQKVELAWPLYELEKKRALEREQAQGNMCIDKKTGRFLKSPDRPKKEGLSAELFGKKIGVGHTFVGMVEYLKIHASKEILEDVRIGNMSAVKAYDLIRGLKLIPDGKKPEKAIKFCPDCSTETTSPKIKKCHVHTWFCCSHCGWGV